MVGMLVIRKEQRDVLREYMKHAFQVRMLKHLRENFQQNTKDISEDDLLTTIRAGIDKAVSYGIKYESDLQTFLECIICFGHDFDTNPTIEWAGKVLRDKRFNASEKMHMLNKQRPTVDKTS